MFLHCEAEELSCDGPIVLPDLNESNPPTPRIEQTNGFSHISAPSTPAGPPKSEAKTATPPMTDGAEVEQALRARILAYDDEVDASASLEDSDANTLYAGIKLQMSEIQRAQGAAKRAAKGKGKAPVSAEQDEYRELQVELLKKKLKAIENDYTFRKVDAGGWTNGRLLT